MSGKIRSFQRPSLTTHTFKPSTSGGLKSRFESRNSNPTGNGGGLLLEQAFANGQVEPKPSGLKQQFFKRQLSKTLYNNMSASSSQTYEEIPEDNQSGYHSIHRLSHLGGNQQQGGESLKRAVDARTGGNTRRSLGRGQIYEDLLEKHANIIVSKMEQDKHLMEDSPDAEELRKMALRDMPQCLTIKRCVKSKLSISVSQKSKRRSLSYWKMFKYHISLSFAQLKLNIKDLAYSFELWYGPLKNIEGNFGTGVASYFKFLRWLFLLNLLIALIAIAFIVIPVATYYSMPQISNVWNFISDIVTGEGYLTNTPLFYGFYTVETIGSSSLPYSMPHAYFYTMFLIYFLSFAVIGVSAAKSYRRSFIETEGGLNVLANKIFCGWDYNIATKDAADLKKRAIYSDLRELIFDLAHSKYKTTFFQKFLLYAVRIFMNIVLLTLIAGCAIALWYFLENIPEDRETKIIYAPVFVNAVMTFMPMFLSFIVRYEEYKDPKVALSLTLGRTFLLGGVIIGVSVAYWLKTDELTCWQTPLAQEFYRMIIFDFFISVIFTALLQTILYTFYRVFMKNSHLEFDIAWNTMQIIYNQTLFWVGLVFSPLLPVVVVIKLLATWYIRYAIVAILCKPSTKTWRAAQTSTWFLVMTFLSMLCITALVAFLIFDYKSATQCGPFTSYDHIYDIILIDLFRLQPDTTAWTVVTYITKPGVVAVFLLFLAVRVYYARAQANAQKGIVAQYRHMLTWSSIDKERLYSLISQATKGQYQYEFHDSNNPQMYLPGFHFAEEPTDQASVASTPSTSSSSYPDNYYLLRKSTCYN